MACPRPRSAADLTPAAVVGRSRSARGAGFTLIEIMIVVVIILILMSLLVVGLIAGVDRAKRNQTRLTLKDVQSIADEFTRINNGYVLQITSCQFEGSAVPADLKDASGTGTKIIQYGGSPGPPSVPWSRAIGNSMAFVAATNVGQQTAAYNSLPKGTLASYSNSTYIVDAWGFPIIYLAYGDGFFPAGGTFSYHRPFFVSAGTPKVKTACNTLDSAGNADQSRYIYSFGEVQQ